MTGRGTSGSWFESLRRDAKLFAAAGILSLIFGLVQPLAVAAAESLPGNFSICTTLGVKQPADEGREAPRDAGCPLCLAGHVCASQITANAAEVPAAISAPPAVSASPLPFRGHLVLGSRPGDPPPGIRAPPFSA